MAKTKSKKLHKKGNFTLFIMIGGIIIVLLSAFIVNTSNINSNPQAALTIAERRARTLAELKKEQAKLKAKQAQKIKNIAKKQTGITPTPVKKLTGTEYCRSIYGAGSVCSIPGDEKCNAYYTGINFFKNTGLVCHQSLFKAFRRWCCI